MAEISDKVCDWRKTASVEKPVRENGINHGRALPYHGKGCDSCEGKNKNCPDISYKV